MTHEKALQCLLSVVHNDPGHTHLPVTPDLTPHIQVATTKDKVLLQHFFSLSSFLLLNHPLSPPPSASTIPLQVVPAALLVSTGSYTAEEAQLALKQNPVIRNVLAANRT